MIGFWLNYTLFVMVTLVLWLRQVIVIETHPDFYGYWASILIIEFFVWLHKYNSMEPYQGGLAHEW
jgi:hypothetical protein